MGEYESLNFLIGIDPEDLALFNIFYRTSPKGRQDFINLMFSDEDEEVSSGMIDSFYVNRVVEIFKVILKCLGLRLDFVEDNDILEIFNNDELSPHKIGDTYYLCTNYQAYILDRINDIREEILEEQPIMLSSNLKNEIIARLKEYKYVTGDFEDEQEIYSLSESLMMNPSEIEEYENREQKIVDIDDDVDEDIDISDE